MEDIFSEGGATGSHAFQGGAAHSAQPIAQNNVNAATNLINATVTPLPAINIQHVAPGKWPIANAIASTMTAINSLDTSTFPPNSLLQVPLCGHLANVCYLPLCSPTRQTIHFFSHPTPMNYLFPHQPPPLFPSACNWLLSAAALLLIVLAGKKLHRANIRQA